MSTATNMTLPSTQGETVCTAPTKAYCDLRITKGQHRPTSANLQSPTGVGCFPSSDFVHLERFWSTGCFSSPNTTNPNVSDAPLDAALTFIHRFCHQTPETDTPYPTFHPRADIMTLQLSATLPYTINQVHSQLYSQLYFTVIQWECFPVNQQIGISFLPSSWTNAQSFLATHEEITKHFPYSVAESVMSEWYIEQVRKSERYIASLQHK